MESDEKTRIDAFVEAYGKLVEEHKVDFANYPAYIPDGNGGFRLIIQSMPVDTTKYAVKSPFVEEA